jgi:hypothetical protein
MTRYIVLAAFALLFCAGPSAVAAADGITVIASNVNLDFPSQALFTIRAESPAQIVDIRLDYQVDKMNYADVVSEGWADFTPGDTVDASWVWDMRNSSLPPGAKVTYWWIIEDADGNRFQTSPLVMQFDDDRHSWHSLADTIPGVGELTIFWYQGTESFAQELMNACEAGLSTLSQDIGAYPEKPIEIYVYASADDMQGAMISSNEWSGGVAFTDFGLIAIGIPSGQLDWGKGALVHELTHLVVREATFSPYGQLPIWLDEGLAMYNEVGVDPSLDASLRGTVAGSDLISVRTLCSPFSAYSDKAYLSYAESYSLVKYLLDNYGQDKMLDLLAALKQGNTYDEALTGVYGFDIEGLDANWRARLAAATTEAAALSDHAGLADLQGQTDSASTAPLSSTLLTVLAALATALAAWAWLYLEKRTWRRPSERSTTERKP